MGFFVHALNVPNLERTIRILHVIIACNVNFNVQNSQWEHADTMFMKIIWPGYWPDYISTFLYAIVIYLRWLPSEVCFFRRKYSHDLAMHRQRTVTELGDTWQTVVEMLLTFSLWSQDNEYAYCPLHFFKDCLTSVAQSIATFSQQLLEFQLNVSVYYLFLMKKSPDSCWCVKTCLRSGISGKDNMQGICL